MMNLLDDFILTPAERKQLKPKFDACLAAASATLAQFNMATDDMDDLEIALCRGMVLAVMIGQPFLDIHDVGEENAPCSIANST